jgi:hypothetical protein
VPAHRSRGQSLTGRRGPYRAPPPRTRTSTDPAHRSRRAPGVPRLGASSRVSPGGGATAGGLKAYRSHPLPYATTWTEAVPLDHDDSEPPDPGRRAPPGHHVEAVALVDCRPLHLGRTPVCGTLSGRSLAPMTRTTWSRSRTRLLRSGWPPARGRNDPGRQEGGSGADHARRGHYGLVRTQRRGRRLLRGAAAVDMVFIDGRVKK